jgi:uncharacterized protein YbjT (DUF2867 family)
MQSTNPILVVGATGMLGKPVADELHAAGFNVRVLTRSPAKTRALFPANVEIATGDIADHDSLRQALAGCHGVHINLKGGPRDADYERIEHQGVRAVVAAAQTSGIQQITYLSAYTIAATTARSPESRAKWLAEEAIRASGIPYTIFRATWFMESLPLFVQGRMITLFGRQPHRLHWLAAADYATMVRRSYQTPAARAKELYLYGPEALTMHEALQRYRARLQPHLPIVPLPLWFSGMLGWVTSNIDLQSITTLMAYYNHHGETGDPQPAQQLLGSPITTLDAWLATQQKTNTPELQQVA